nr:MAG TPA: hypothetical protein [Caudoviricetes sp.]
MFYKPYSPFSMTIISVFDFLPCGRRLVNSKPYLITLLCSAYKIKLLSYILICSFQRTN